MIAVIGLGYVGLTTALGFCHKGFTVYGIDSDLKKLNLISCGKMPFYARNMQYVLNKNINKKFHTCKALTECIDNVSVIFLCVETPIKKSGKTNLTYLKNALKSVLSAVKLNKTKNKKLIVIKSTVPPSTTEKIVIPFIEKKGFTAGKDIFVANNPEFLRQANAWSDFINQDRIIIGATDNYSKKLLKKVYKPFKKPVCFVTPATSEFTKYLSNSFLAMLLSYSNEMSLIANSINGIDIASAFKLFHKDKRWFGSPAAMCSYVYPNAGFGGSCLPKDTAALLSKSIQTGYKARLLKDVLTINEKIKIFWADKISKNIKPNSNITVLGLAFKPNTDDVRNTPSYEIIKLLLKKGFNNITVYDPVSNKTFDNTYKLPVKYAVSTKQAVKNADVIILATVWKEFLDSKHLFKNKKIFDLRYKL